MLTRAECLVRPGTDDEIVYHEIIEEDMYRHKEITERIGNGWIIDIGAHIGIFTRLMRSAINSPCLSLEPDFENFQLLSKVPDTVKFNVAADANTGVKHLQGSGTARKRIGDSGPLCLCVDIEMMLRGFDISLIKCDIEGHENVIMEKLRPAICRTDVFILEQHDNNPPHEFVERCGMELWFQPYGSPAHNVYARKSK